MFSHRIRAEVELRLFEHAHAERLFALLEQNRAYLRRWLPDWDLQKSVDECSAMIKSVLEQHAAKAGFSAGIWYQGRLAGVVGMGRIDWENKSTNIGYWLGEEFQGKGLVTDSCRALLSYVFTDLKLNRVEIRCATDNPKSSAVPRRLGFQKEGVLRQSAAYDDRFLDIEVHSLLAEEWKTKEQS